MENPREENEFTLWSVIIQARDVIFRARDKELSQYGITAVEARALFIINLLDEEVTPAMISRWMLREHNTVTALLNRMDNKGLISRRKDPEKRNSWLISLTDKGRTAYENSLKRELVQKIFSVIPEDEQHRMLTYLRKVSDEALKYMVDDISPPQ